MFWLNKCLCVCLKHREQAGVSRGTVFHSVCRTQLRENHAKIFIWSTLGHTLRLWAVETLLNHQAEEHLCWRLTSCSTETPSEHLIYSVCVCVCVCVFTGDIIEEQGCGGGCATFSSPVSERQDVKMSESLGGRHIWSFSARTKTKVNTAASLASIQPGTLKLYLFSRDGGVDSAGGNWSDRGNISGSIGLESFSSKFQVPRGWSCWVLGPGGWRRGLETQRLMKLKWQNQTLSRKDLTCPVC